MSEPLSDRRGLLPRFTLKDGDTFLLADALGDVQGSDDGLFTNDTRMLSRYEIEIAGRRPSLLGAAVNQDNTLFTAHLTNRPLPALGELSIPKGVIHIERSRLLWDGRLHERLKVTNFGEHDVTVPLRFAFDADFADIFEVQGHTRPGHGKLLPAEITERGVQLSYHGLDDVVRTTWIEFSQTPVSMTPKHAEFHMELPRGGSAELFVDVGSRAQAVPSRTRFNQTARELSASMQLRLQQSASIMTSARLLNQWIDRSRSDLALLTTPLETGPYPYAGIPWFATQFGRDAIITSLETLWLNPQLAAGVLKFLASTQARQESAFREAEPGKILHEMRRGEMASLGEVPFGRYYGAVDSTPLFVMLAGAYEERTGDRSLNDEIWSALLAATAWIEARLDASPSGFLDYARTGQRGLVNQAWKDSHDSIFHADGEFPQPPISVVEVQGYAFAALDTMGTLAARRGDMERSAAWRARAEQLRAAIEERFWVSDMNYYALALDAHGRPCNVYASNPGHLLFCGVPGPQRAAAVKSQLLSSRFLSGWGIRTLAEGQPRYNPMSYHNGSVWPHDTAMCTAGIARYDGRRDAVQILSQIFETANHFGMRLPELYCGFARISGQGPTPYPVACLPQAWASGSVFMLLQASLGIHVNGAERQVQIDRPMLPEGVESLTVRDLSVDGALIDLHFHRIGEEVAVAPARHVESGILVIGHF